MKESDSKYKVINVQKQRINLILKNEEEADKNSEQNQIISLFEESKIAFESKDSQNLLKSLQNIHFFIQQNKVVLNDVFTEYAFFIMNVIDHYLNQNEEQILFFAMKILLLLNFYSDNVMNNLLQNNSLSYFVNLMTHPVIGTIAIYIVAHFFSNPQSFQICHRLNVLNDLEAIFENILSCNDHKLILNNLNILKVISKAFNNAIKFQRNIQDEENISQIYDDIIRTNRKICQLYSAALCKNLLIDDRFIEFIQIQQKQLSCSENQLFIDILFANHIPQLFWSILINQPQYYPSTFYFFAYLTSNISCFYINSKDNDDISLNFIYQFNDFFHVEKFLNLLNQINESSQEIKNYMKYYIQTIENISMFDSRIFLLGSYINFISYLNKCLNECDFEIKYNAAHCIYSSLCIAPLDTIREFFSCDIMISALEMLESQIPEFLTGILNALYNAIIKINEYGVEMYKNYRIFENKLVSYLNDLIEFDDENVRNSAALIEKCICPDTHASRQIQ